MGLQQYRLAKERQPLHLGDQKGALFQANNVHTQKYKEFNTKWIFFKINTKSDIPSWHCVNVYYNIFTMHRTKLCDTLGCEHSFKKQKNKKYLGNWLATWHMHENIDIKFTSCHQRLQLLISLTFNGLKKNLQHQMAALVWINVCTEKICSNNRIRVTKFLPKS